MSRTITAEVFQVGVSASRGKARIHEVAIDRPVSKGGSDEGPMGGELLLLALGGCFMSNLLAAIASRDASISHVQVTVEAALEGAPEAMTAFTLRVQAHYEDRAVLEKLVTIAERGCIVANTLRQSASLKVVVEPPTQ